MTDAVSDSHEGKMSIRGFIIASLVKIAVLFLVLFFTIEVPTFMIYLLVYLSPLYFLIYGVLAIVLSQFPRRYVIKKNFFTRYILNLLIMGSGVALCFGIIHGGMRLKEEMREIRFRSFINKSEVVLEHGGTWYVSGVMGTELERNAVAIDYDTHSVLVEYDGDIYYIYKLQPTEEVTGLGKLQSEYELSSPGKRFTTYCSDEGSYDHITTGILLEMENGEKYYKRIDKEFLDLDGAEYKPAGEEKNPFK